jgi:hypothetical protein
MRKVTLKPPTEPTQESPVSVLDDTQTDDSTTNPPISFHQDPSNPIPEDDEDQNDPEDPTLLGFTEIAPDSAPDSPPDSPDSNRPSEIEEPRPEEVNRALVGSVERRGGHNRKKPKSGPLVEGDEQLVLPTPPYRRFTSNSINPKQRTAMLWAWVKTLQGWVQNRATWYVYREWPVLKDLKEDEEREERESRGEKVEKKKWTDQGPHKYIDKVLVNGELAIHDDTDFLNRYGCGKYRVLLNVAGAGALAEGWVTDLGGSFRDHPPTDPRINDIEQLEIHHPDNRSYLEYLRTVGKHPDQLAGKKEDNDVANVQAIEKMGETVHGLVDKVISMAEKQMEAGKSSTDASSLEKAMDVVADGAKRSNEIVMEALERARGLREKENAGNGAGVETLTVLMELIEKMGLMRGSGGEDSELRKELAEVRRELGEARNQELAALREELRSLRNNPPSGGATLIEQFKVFKDFRQMFRDEEERENPVREAVGEAAGEMAPKWMRPYLPLVQAVVTGYLQAKMPGQGQQPGMPGMPMPPPGMPPSPPQLQPAPPPLATGVNPGPGAAAPGSTPTPPTPIHAFIGLIAPGISTHLQEGKSGLDFTDWFINGFGSPTYDEILGYGFTTETLKSTLLSHPALGPFLKTVEDGRVTKFVDEFLNYDSLVEKDSTATEPVKEGA